MPYALVLIGAVLLVAGIRGTYADLWTLFKGDFTGTNSYLTWVAALAVIGGIGYIPKLKPLSVALMTLLLLVIVISRKGVFSKLQQFATTGLPAAAPPNSPQAALDTVGKFAQTAENDVGPAASIAANLAMFA